MCPCQKNVAGSEVVFHTTYTSCSTDLQAVFCVPIFGESAKAVGGVVEAVGGGAEVVRGVVEAVGESAEAVGGVVDVVGESAEAECGEAEHF